MDKKIVEELKENFNHNRRYALAKDHYTATSQDNFKSLALSIRDRLIDRWILTQQKYHDSNCKRVYYLSLEFLIGRLLESNIMNLGLDKESEKAISELGFDLKELYDQESDAGLGNGGLGRLAACFLDSMATLGIPATGYGIRYDYGIFRQKIVNGAQVELPEEWLMLGNPWEFDRPEFILKIKFYGKTVKSADEKGSLKIEWVDTEDVLAMAYDIPVPGYKNDVVNNLRLWSAKSSEEFHLDYFNDGNYIKACENKILTENISRVLYPNDNAYEGMELRLKQEYFFTSASIQDIIRRFKMHNDNFSLFPEKVAIQLNDTHPAIAIVELMRILLDVEYMKWEDAWDITRNTFAYTNHTIMPEALEMWPISFIERLLPRHLEIIYEINKRFLREVAERFPKDTAKQKSMSIIDETGAAKVRMGHLSIVGSHSVNGVSKLHTELLKTTLFSSFHQMYPEKFKAITNGITQRRWLKKANPLLSALVTESIGDGWIKNLREIKKITDFLKDKSFRDRWRSIKRKNKIDLASYIEKENKIILNPDSIFDVQVKRIHEYKRQVLFALYLISQYLRIKNEPGKNWLPRSAIIGGKAAPGYVMAKLIIKFINNVAKTINGDKAINDKLRIVFLENYCVSLAEKVFPASDLSEQISTAGREASGTGNMKFMLNGAVTIGTMDGATVEMAEELSKDDIFIFGLDAKGVDELKSSGYSPKDYMAKDPLLKDVITLIKSNFFSKNEPGIFNPLISSLIDFDQYMIFADFADYVKTQDMAADSYIDVEGWTDKSIRNTANAGKFSSDRTIKEYSKEIWGV